MDSPALLHQLHCIPQHRQRTKSQEVHLQKPQFLNGGHGKLGSDRAVRSSGQRHQLLCRSGTDYHTCRMHRGMSWQAFQSLTHVNQMLYLRIRLIHLTQLRIDLQGTVNGNVQLIGNHLCKRIHIRIGQIHHSSHITDDSLGSQGTEGNNLHHLFGTVFAADIINHLLSSFEAEVNINIRHGNTFRIQKSFKQQIIFNGINIGNLQAVGNDTSCRRTTSRTYHNTVLLGIVNKVPNDQEIIHIAHGPDNTKLIIQTLPKALPGGAGRRIHILSVSFHKAVITKLI